jgi:hypothetical protein
MRTPPLADSRRWIAVIFALLVVTLAGCGKTVISNDAYHLVSALDRIFEKRDPQQLSQASQKIQEELAAGKITAEEASVLNALIDTAKSNNWDTASADARQLLADQTDW